MKSLECRIGWHGKCLDPHCECRCGKDTVSKAPKVRAAVRKGGSGKGGKK